MNALFLEHFFFTRVNDVVEKYWIHLVWIMLRGVTLKAGHCFRRLVEMVYAVAERACYPEKPVASLHLEARARAL